MTKPEVLDALRDFSKTFPAEALREIQSNREDYISEMLESLDYSYRNAKELRDGDNDYFLHIYAMYLLAEFREKRAFPLLVNFLRLPEDEIDFTLGDGLTEGFSRLLLCVFDSENIQMLFDVIENPELYEWARRVAIDAYGLLISEGFISKEEGILYLRSLICQRLAPDDSYVVFTEIVGCVIYYQLMEMIPDVRFLYDNDMVDESMYGKYDSFIDWLFYKDSPIKTYIDDAISAMENWACFEREEENKLKANKGDFSNLFEDMAKSVGKKSAIEQKPGKIGRNEPCFCGSGKKYKKCCINAQKNAVSVVRLEDQYDLFRMYPKNSVQFEQMYEKEAIDIDKLAYKALHHRSIPMWEKRDYEQERIDNIDYLDEALTLFLDKCERDNITSFSAYDEQFMIHYKSDEWVSAIMDLTEEDSSEKSKSIRAKAKDVLQKFE